MDLTADGWTWNEPVLAWVRITDARDALEIQVSLPVTGSFRYDPNQTDGDPAEQVEAAIAAIAHTINQTIVPPGIAWLDAANLNPEQVGTRITNLIRNGHSFVYIAEKDRANTRLYTTGT
jgi:hypothetical protein